MGKITTLEKDIDLTSNKLQALEQALETFKLAPDQCDAELRNKIEAVEAQLGKMQQHGPSTSHCCC